MSELVCTVGELGVGTYCGPAHTPSRSRRRWQFTVLDGSAIAVLTEEELAELLAAVLKVYGHLPHGTRKAAR